MEIIPAIDLRNGKAVRLVQGDYNRETVFDDDPAAVARNFEQQGAQRIHLVDLDGAREGNTGQAELAATIATAVSIPVQLGGGVRSMDDIAALIDAVSIASSSAPSPSQTLSLSGRRANATANTSPSASTPVMAS